MKKHTLLAVILVNMCFLSYSSAQVVRKGNDYNFLIHWQKGKIYRFIATVVIEDTISGKNHLVLSNQMPITLKVEEVKNGIATLNIGTSLPSMKRDKASGAFSKVRVNSHGSIVGGEPGVGAAMFGKWFPKSKVQVGSRWSFPVQHFGPLSGLVPEKKLIASCTFKGILQEDLKKIGVMKSGKKELAEIEITVPRSSKGSSLFGNFFVDTSDGILEGAALVYSVLIPGPDKSATIKRTAKVQLHRQ